MFRVFSAFEAIEYNRKLALVLIPFLSLSTLNASLQFNFNLLISCKHTKGPAVANEVQQDQNMLRVVQRLKRTNRIKKIALVLMPFLSH